MAIPSMRQEKIMEWLALSSTLTIDQLVEQLGVSIMTVHRDLDVLARAGLVEKVHGGVIKSEAKVARTRTTPICNLCDNAVSNRTTITIQPLVGDPIHGCCPHCGLLLINERREVVSLLARDFIYGRNISMTQAVYVTESVIVMCCMPSILCFASWDDAARFQRGFGGAVMHYDDVHRWVTDKSHNGATFQTA